MSKFLLFFFFFILREFLFCGPNGALKYEPYSHQNIFRTFMEGLVFEPQLIWILNRRDFGRKYLFDRKHFHSSDLFLVLLIETIFIRSPFFAETTFIRNAFAQNILFSHVTFVLFFFTSSLHTKKTLLKFCFVSFKSN